MKTTKTAFVGRWRITEMDEWDQDYVDEVSPGHVTFEKNGTGTLHFGTVDVGLDWRYDPALDRVDFTFDGFAECDQVTGRGWAKVDGKQLVGFFAFHLGDESGFKAKKGK